MSRNAKPIHSIHALVSFRPSIFSHKQRQVSLGCHQTTSSQSSHFNALASIDQRQILFLVRIMPYMTQTWRLQLYACTLSPQRRVDADVQEIRAASSTSPDVPVMGLLPRSQFKEFNEVIKGGKLQRLIGRSL